MVSEKRKVGQRGWGWAIAAGVAALGLLGLGVAQIVASRRAAFEAELTEVPAPTRVEVVALGRLEPRGEVVRVGGPTGERIQRLEVRQGDIVQTGTVLAYLESYDERRAQRDVAAAQLAEAEQRLRATTTFAQAQVREAQSQAERIQSPAQFELQAQQALVRELEADLAQKNQDLRRFEDLYAQGAISQQERDRQRSTARQSEEKLNNARANLVRLEADLQASLRSAQATVQAQEANLPLSQVQVAVESARQNLNLAEAQLERTIIRAPQAGRILRILTLAGETIGQDGSVLDMGDTSQMFVVAEVYETDVGLVRVGQPAMITSRNGAFDETLSGRVAEIGWQVFKNNVLDDDPAANADARVVEVKVQLDDGRPVEALTNLQVDVRIDVR
ncbi:HlyD family efflux transporter periplasmic adaptor subunit [Thermoleptolyngbya sichuanensis A183]|uniref:HlyD family efflux transporter periplasmic adaptor subunit n=1 Tax=Thermoleptolyngbya sichuanensis A183 TaxID=2737172 RepID=A0A6M8B9W7_9CYAN|nr:efflux RND transporter periplasmic adaptor subunit [Thermoleptolyngbya sichuanensis]QKD83278.1 HlyD family efflux transporter periplasmic adaptor subunit [Thermoleptolyngbya sichuanensis A183]